MDLKQVSRKYKLHHLFIWLFAGAIWYYLRYTDYSSKQTALEVTAIKIADLALMIYAANYLLIPKLLYRKKYFLFFFCFVAMIFFSSIYKMFLLGKLTHNPALMNWSGDFKKRLYDNVIPHFFLVIAGVAIKFLVDYISIQKRLMVVAKEKAETELSFLKSQINPHFLFNSLNSVYFLIDKTNTEARQALHKFSEMLRYQLYEIKDEKIPIEKEVSYLQDYIALQQLRSENISVKMNIDRTMKSFFIEPLLLIPFVENSFKHLSHYSDGKTNTIGINLSRNDKEIDFSISNTTEAEPVQRLNGGIGLKNVKRRLELLYPDKHKLFITEGADNFHVHLKINIEA